MFTDNISHHTLKVFKKKYAKGEYKEEQAVIGYKRIADLSAKRYAKEMCSSESDWNTVFSVPDRLEVARRIERRYFAEYIKIEDVVIATGYRGQYILKSGCWVYNDAMDTGYGSCVIGDIDHFKKMVERNPEDYKLTEKGSEIINAMNTCKKGVRCKFCNNKFVCMK